MIYQSVSWQVDDIASDQASEYAHTQKLEGGVFKHSLHLFAFLANNGNDVVYRGALPDDLRRSMIQKIAKRQKTGLIEAVTPHGEKSLIIYAMEPVEKDGRQLGYILVGKEINRTHEQIEGWFRLLFVLSLGAACLSVIIAHFLPDGPSFPSSAIMKNNGPLSPTQAMKCGRRSAFSPLRLNSSRPKKKSACPNHRRKH
jgi:hypothetical protein